MRPSGLVAVVVPSGFRVMVQPQRWIRTRWWKEHRGRQLVRLVVPSWLRGMMWWTWQAGGGWSQPGAAQCRSRVMMARRDDVGDGAGVQGQADRGGGVGQGGGAEPGGQAAGSGEQGDGAGQDQVPGGALAGVLASSRPAARPSSGKDSSRQACTGPSQEPAPSSPCAARRPAASGRPSATTVTTRQEPPDLPLPEDDYLGAGPLLPAATS